MKVNNIVKMCKWFFLSLCCVGMVQAQVREQESENEWVFPGPKKTIVIAAAAFSSAGGTYQPANPAERIQIERADNGSKNFKKLGEIHFPAAAAELEKRLGGYIADVCTQLQCQSAQQAYDILLKHGTDTLGLLLIATEVQEAVGLTFVDYERDPQKASTYRVSKQGSSSAVLMEVKAGLPRYDEKYRLEALAASDSAVTLSWYSLSKMKEETMPRIATIYKQIGHRGAFKEHSRQLVLNNGDSDSTFVRFSEEVHPGENLGYFMQVEDIAGNRGLASDTAYMITVDRGAIKPILRLDAQDTLGGVLLTWDAIPDESLYSGIQILKSRKADSDFVVLDTVPITDTAYLDLRVLQSSSYFYRVRPLLYNLPDSDPMNFAETTGAVGLREDVRPQRPVDVQAHPVEQGIAVTWQQGEELNLFGYYVLRGTSDSDMEVISPPVQDLMYIDTAIVPGYSGQLQYAVQAISLNQQVSDTSEIASLAVRQPVNLNPPGGLQSRWSDVGVALEWEDVMRRDSRVEGYMLYRKKEEENNFVPLFTELYKLPFFKDTTTISSQAYDYAVTSIDSWGNQSILSTVSSLKGEVKQTLLLPQELYLRNLRTGIEVFWPESAFKAGEQYVIYRKSADQKTAEKIGTSAPDAPFVDRQVQNNQLYEYTIRIVSASGEGQTGISHTIRRDEGGV